MIFEKVLNELTIDTGEAGHSFKEKISAEEAEKIKEKEKKEKRKRSRKRVFGSWFTSHNNLKHANK